jgi:hypothetical protein
MRISHITVTTEILSAAPDKEKVTVNFTVPTSADEGRVLAEVVTAVTEAVEAGKGAVAVGEKVLEMLAKDGRYEVEKAKLQKALSRGLRGKIEATPAIQVGSLFFAIYAAKRIQRTFRSYGRRRDAKTLMELLGV